jgi:hypothetical protein
MNRHGEKAMAHWKRWLPTRFSRITEPETFFTNLGEEIEIRKQELTAAIAGDDPPNESYMEKLGRLGEAELTAEGQALRELALLEPEPGAPGAENEPKA